MPKPWYEESYDRGEEDRRGERDKKNPKGLSFHEHNWDGTAEYKSTSKKVFGGIETTSWYEVNCTCGKSMGKTDINTLKSPE